LLGAADPARARRAAAGYLSAEGAASTADGGVCLPARRRQPAGLPRRPTNVSRDRARAPASAGQLLERRVSARGRRGRLAGGLGMDLRPLALVLVAAVTAACSESSAPAAPAPKSSAAPAAPELAPKVVSPE